MKNKTDMKTELKTNILLLSVESKMMILQTVIK